MEKTNTCLHALFPGVEYNTGHARASFPEDAINLFPNFDFSLLGLPEVKEDSVHEALISPMLHALGYSDSGTHKIIRSKSLANPFALSAAEVRQATANCYFRGLLYPTGTHPESPANLARERLTPAHTPARRG